MTNPTNTLESKPLQLTLSDVARICHEANRAYRATQGDESRLSWEESPIALHLAVVQGVQNALKHPDLTPEQSHENWMTAYAANGWTYGETEDRVKKTHPCFLPWHELSEFHRRKDILFLSIVRTFQGSIVHQTLVS